MDSFYESHSWIQFIFKPRETPIPILFIGIMQWLMSKSINYFETW